MKIAIITGIGVSLGITVWAFLHTKDLTITGLVLLVTVCFWAPFYWVANKDK